MNEDDIQKAIENAFKQLFKNQQPEEKESDNPSDYPRSIKIVDSDILMLITEQNMLLRKLERMMSEAKLVHAQGHVLTQKKWMMLEDKYPDVANLHDPLHTGNGVRYWKGEWYYVSWDREQPDDPAKRS